MRFRQTPPILLTYLLPALVAGAFAVTPARAQGEATGHPLGEPRDDLERFYGVYGDPDAPGRDFFVAEAVGSQDMEEELPPGYLMIGPMWADVAPWYMASVSEAEFEQRWVGDFQREPVVVAFEFGEDGEAVALVFETVIADRGRLERLRDLPEGWR